MRKLKKIIALGMVVGSLCVMAIPTMAESKYTSRAEIAAALTGMTLEEVIDERATTGKTYGEIADEAGKFEEFQDEVYKLTGIVCDGTGKGTGRGQGRGNGGGRGQGCGTGQGRGMGQGRGACYR